MKFSDLKLTTPYLKHEPLFYDEVDPTPLREPFVISLSNDAAQLLGVDEDLKLDDKLLNIVNGAKKLDGSQTFSMCYAGHQFGYFVPRLGDGRAINLGKVNGQNLQLKGSGLTLYSCQGDGRAVLRSSIREYLMSEAMHGLKISTSRAIALIGSDTDVPREKWEKGAIVLRLSPTWVRFGTFEYFNAKGEHAKLQKLADYVIDESFPNLKNSENQYLEMYRQVIKNTAITVSKWQCYGFNHGVMNTDNMSIDGRTIDYEPFAFLDDYESGYICNHTDQDGRYSFKNQPGIAHWNLQQLAKALSPIVNYKDALEVLEQEFTPTYEDAYLKLMYQKMGFFTTQEKDIELLKRMLETLESATIDFTSFFRKLSTYKGDKKSILEISVYQEPLKEWLELYDKRLKQEEVSQDAREQKMLKVNAKYILKNHILQEAINDAKENNFKMIDDLLRVALSPFEEHKELEYLNKPTPLKSKNIKLSCSS